MYTALRNSYGAGWQFQPTGETLASAADIQAYVDRLDQSLCEGECGATLRRASIALDIAIRPGLPRAALTTIDGGRGSVTLSFQPGVLHRAGEVGGVSCAPGLCLENLILHEFLHVVITCLQLQWDISAVDWADCLVSGGCADAPGDMHCIFFMKLLAVFSRHSTVDNTVFT